MKKLRIILWIAAFINFIPAMCLLMGSTAEFNVIYSLFFMGPIGAAGLIQSIIMLRKDKKNGNANWKDTIVLIFLFVLSLAFVCFMWILLIVDALFSEDTNVAINLIRTAAQFA